MNEVIFKGTSNKGILVFDKQFSDVQAHNFGNIINDMHHSYPDAVCITMQIAFPDPEFVKNKEALVSFLEENGIRDTKVQAKALAFKLMKAFVIKLPEAKDE